jgi:hypothetical protein
VGHMYPMGYELGKERVMKNGEKRCTHLLEI